MFAYLTKEKRGNLAATADPGTAAAAGRACRWVAPVPKRSPDGRGRLTAGMICYL